MATRFIATVVCYGWQKLLLRFTNVGHTHVHQLSKRVCFLTTLLSMACQNCSSPEILHNMPLHEANLTTCPTTGEKGTETQLPILENTTDYFTISETILPPEKRNQSKDIRHGHGLPRVTYPSAKNEIGSIPNKVAFEARDAILITCVGVFSLLLVVAVSVATKHAIQKKLNEHPDGPNQNVEPREIAERSYVSPGPPNVLMNPVYERHGDYATVLPMGQSPILPTPSTDELSRRVSNNRQRTLENVLYGRNQADCQFDSDSLYFSRRLTL